MQIDQQEYLNLLMKVGGYYECPKDSQGKRLGPLVGYAGEYDSGKNFVGDIYVNVAKAEEHTHIMSVLAEALYRKMLKSGVIDLQLIENEKIVLCGMPMGGLSLANVTALQYGGRYVYPEKEILTKTADDQRDKTVLRFKRHKIIPGNQVIIVEDICNNFSTTSEAIKLAGRHGGTVVAIACFLNRSAKYTDQYQYNDSVIPVISLVQKSFAQYRQDDPAVAEDIAAGNIVWKPKDNWEILKTAMEQNQQN